MKPKSVFILFLYILLINMFVYVISISVIGGDVGDIDFYNSISSGRVIPNDGYFDVETGKIVSIKESNDVSDSVVENFKESVENETGIIQYFNMFVAKWLDLHDAEHDITAGGTPRGVSSEDDWFGNFIRAFDEFIGSVFLAFNFLLGMLSFSIINVLGDVVNVPDYLRFFLFLACLPVYLFVVYWIAPFAIDALKMIAHWIEAMIPF